jgi:hypothetical protein
VGGGLPYGCTVVAISAYADEEVQAALLRLLDAGYPVLLLTVGDEPPPVSPEIEHRHLGGSDAWAKVEKLATA